MLNFYVITVFSIFVCYLMAVNPILLQQRILAFWGMNFPVVEKYSKSCCALMWNFFDIVRLWMISIFWVYEESLACLIACVSKRTL